MWDAGLAASSSATSGGMAPSRASECCTGLRVVLGQHSYSDLLGSLEYAVGLAALQSLFESYSGMERKKTISMVVSVLQCLRRRNLRLRGSCGGMRSTRARGGSNRHWRKKPSKLCRNLVKALELQHDKIENLSTTVASLSASSLTQVASLANLEKLVQQLLTSLGRPYGLATSFRHADTPDHKCVPLAAHHMIGKAQLWYHSEIAVSPFASWASFKKECCLSFGPPRSINTLGELKLLFQSSRHIDDYVNDFRAHLAHASTVLPAQRVDLFTGGLDEVLRIDVERTKPSSLNEAINTAPIKALQKSVKALQKSVKALELQHDKIENLSTIVASLSASSLTQAASLANLEKLIQQLLTSLGKQPVQEEDSVTTVPTEGISTMADIGDH
nr:uncharacterized protein LOC109160849 [Ipomoea batatas]